MQRIASILALSTLVVFLIAPQAMARETVATAPQATSAEEPEALEVLDLDALFGAQEMNGFATCEPGEQLVEGFVPVYPIFNCNISCQDFCDEQGGRLVFADNWRVCYCACCI